MDVKDLDGIYELTIKTNGGGAYSFKPISGNICIENGQIKGIDELNVMWFGTLKYIKENEVKYSITIEPKKAHDTIITRRPDGTMTSKHQNFIGRLSVVKKDDGRALLSTLVSNKSNEYYAVVSFKRTSLNTDCAICKI